MTIIRFRYFIEIIGLARSTIDKLIGAGEFPRPVPLLGLSLGWVEREVQKWIQARIAQRDRDSSTLSPSNE
ncbi:helix-turn-helix transcriptional regulator [Pseudomonas pseudonitroreducens]|uniref:helix-turn-helix transcriptional regulator n=1 Tax=Pseudomonas pseudonitroreducens TaxID=2892326 RepID=UPI001F17505D|nr:AlpA family phage regulatory protein [Pseudomonas pseudonitroreducens]